MRYPARSLSAGRSQKKVAAWSALLTQRELVVTPPGATMSVVMTTELSEVFPARSTARTWSTLSSPARAVALVELVRLKWKDVVERLVEARVQVVSVPPVISYRAKLASVTG